MCASAWARSCWIQSKTELGCSGGGNGDGNGDANGDGGRSDSVDENWGMFTLLVVPYATTPPYKYSRPMLCFSMS